MADDMMPPLPPGYECPPDTVPGWLNADDLPTACVGDLPLVEPLPERTPTPNPTVTFEPPIAEVTPTPTLPPELGMPQDVVRELAATGLDDLGVLVLAAALLTLGGLLALATRIAKTKERTNGESA